MSKKDESDHIHIENIQPEDHEPHRNPNLVSIEEEAAEDVRPLHLGWRTWLVVFIASFTIMAQVYTTIAASTVVTFISRDLGDSALSGWIIQGPLLMQSVLSPIIGRLSDILDRKYLASIPPLVAFIGAVVCAKATSMSTLIGGSMLIGVTLSTIAIVQAIPSEVLPLKYRTVANGIAFLGGACAGVIGNLSAGAYSDMSSSGWRNIFWTQAAFHLTSSLGLLVFYWPPRHSDYPKMNLQEYIWACDPIGSILFIGSATLLLLALDWAAGTYAWSDLHVAVPLGLGCGLLVVFCIYEWKGRSDGLVAHVFFRSGPNFPLSVFAFAVEGWIFYSAVNAITPQMILYLGWESDSWRIAVRQLSYLIPTLVASIPITWYSTRYKDLKSPLIGCFILFLIVTICYTTIEPSWSTTQMGLNILSGTGQSGPLTLLVAAVQYTAPHAYLSTATGLAFSARAIGGAFGSAVLDAIIASYVSAHYNGAVGAAATGAGLSESAVAAVVAAMAEGGGVTSVAGLAAAVPGAQGEDGALEEAVQAGRWVYARAYRRAWGSIVPFVVVAVVCVGFLRGVRELMTEKVEASVERVEEEKEKQEERA